MQTTSIALMSEFSAPMILFLVLQVLHYVLAGLRFCILALLSLDLGEIVGNILEVQQQVQPLPVGSTESTSSFAGRSCISWRGLVGL